MKIGIVAHPDRAEVTAVDANLRTAAAASGVAIVDVADADVVVSIGGDGTLLRAVRAAGPSRPVVGVDVGYVGYLADVEPDAITGLIASLAAGEYAVVEHMTVAVDLPDGTVFTGLNDVVVEKVMSQHALRLRCVIDDEPLITYRADGLIFATPTGSTAYAYSAGGPVVDPSVEALLLVPVAAHNLFSRPLVLQPDSLIELEVLAGRPARINVDGQDLGVAESGDLLRIRRGDKPALLVALDSVGFAARLSTNLGISPE
ncbi:MAG: NAD(+)/NADH kinase [Acidimicrobiia bacterium]|nr:NAD(+)/NADH kinase [Acidimicrobiia bacterium]